ncbi:MAG: glycosyltransferase family 2 protein [Clostridia bacterium]|nr:glycosyltransferase family 2 protein [Clostridia bacterium]
MRFSLMIPVYNAAPYLYDALEGLRAQTCTDFEALLIDDGSTDESGRICDQYAEDDRRFRVWHTDNHGVFAARQFAEAHARGEYLLFLDADDWTDPALLSSLSGVIDRHHPDLISFDFIVLRADVNTVRETFGENDMFLQGKELEIFYRHLLSTRYNSLCIKCFHRKLIACAPDYGSFAGLRHGEDLLRSAYLVFGAENLYYLHRCLYAYRLGTGHSGDFDAQSLRFYERVDAEIFRLLSTRVTADDTWRALYNDLCRKQFDNYLRLLAGSRLPIAKGSALLREAMTLPLTQNALSAAEDSLKYRLLRRSQFRLLLMLHRGKRWLHAQ